MTVVPFLLDIYIIYYVYYIIYIVSVKFLKSLPLHYLEKIVIVKPTQNGEKKPKTTYIYLRFLRVQKLGKDILKKHPDAHDIKDKMQQLQDDQRNILDLWNRKNQELRDSKDLQVCSITSICICLCEN